jgi:TolA-binding protein
MCAACALLSLLCCAQVHDAQIELTAFQALQQQEQLTAPDRIERLKLLLQGQRDREVTLQQQFRQLGQQRDDLQEQLQSLQQQRRQQQQQQAVVAG